MSNPTLLAPVQPGERIQAMDVLRGFALLGILLMNIEGMVGPLNASITGLDPSLTGADRTVDAIILLLVQGKFYTIFSLLFGMGFAMMLARAREASRPFGWVYLRRSLALLAIGLLHAVFVWSGDILTTYSVVALILLFMVLMHGASMGRWALAGVAASLAIIAAAFAVGEPLASLWVVLLWILMGLARLPRQGLLAYAILLLAAMPLMMFLLGGMGSLMLANPETAASWNEEMGGQGEEFARVLAAQREAFASGSFAEASMRRWLDLKQMLAYLPIWGWQILGLFLLGAWLLRKGVISNPAGHAGLLRGLRWLALPLGLAATGLAFVLAPTIDVGRMDFASGSAQGLQMAGGVLQSLGYIAWLLRALETPGGQRVLGLLAPAGRMALTNYLLQSLVATFIFFGYGLGYFEQLPRAWQPVYVFVFFALQVALSHWWMARFRFGPAEWAWRAATYLSLPPMRRG
ncbi:MAG TPA: DUF418 domain-containing protein [Arenimonas sp.]|nr:DUF418 domain-containing protein [Arenimonas sp.]